MDIALVPPFGEAYIYNLSYVIYMSAQASDILCAMYTMNRAQLGSCAACYFITPPTLTIIVHDGNNRCVFNKLIGTWCC